MAFNIAPGTLPNVCIRGSKNNILFVEKPGKATATNGALFFEHVGCTQLFFDHNGVDNIRRFYNESMTLKSHFDDKLRFMAQLLQMQWIKNHNYILIEGPTGTGKTFIACALGQTLCEHGFSVRHFRSSRMLKP